MWNGILTLFKIDKKYYFIHTMLERLRSEGWQYFSLTGRYSGHLTSNNKPTHENQFVFFTHYIEKIKMKQIYEKKIEDTIFKNRYTGKEFENTWYTTLIDHDANGYYQDSSGNEKVLFRFRKGVLNDCYQKFHKKF